MYLFHFLFFSINLLDNLYYNINLKLPSRILILTAFGESVIGLLENPPKCLFLFDIFIIFRSVILTGIVFKIYITIITDILETENML